MAQPRRTSGRDWMGIAAIAVGATIALAGIMLFLSGDNLDSRDMRTVSRALIVGAAAAAYGLYRLGSSGSQGSRRTGKGDGAGAVRGASLEGMLSHSEDAVATLRDITDHGGGGFGDLPELLRRAGLMDWVDAPAVNAHRLRRSGLWWLSFSEGARDAAELERLIALEGALNLYERLVSSPPAPSRSLDARVEAVLGRTHELRPKKPESTEFLDFLLKGADPRGEWACRVRLADAVENLPAPVRVHADFQTNVSAGLAVVDVRVPDPASFPAPAETGSSRGGIAAGYALRAALAIGRAALDSSPAVSRAVINCLGYGGEDFLLSLDLTADSSRRIASKLGSVRDALPQDEALRARQRPDGWLGPVTPVLERGCPEVCPPERFREIELDDSPCPEAVGRACGARRVSDLGISEKAARVSAWHQLESGMGESTQDAVSRLVKMRYEATDVSVAEACERTSKALVEGRADIADLPRLSRIFVDHTALYEASELAANTLEGEPTPEELEEVLARLEGALSPLTETGLYLDDNESVYRYFNSSIERVTYNLTVPGDGRTVRLVPDEYYTAHSVAARILNLLDRPADALSHSEELMRLGPVTPDAALSKVRCLENLSRIFEAAELLTDAIRYASTTYDMAICFYRLAFMEWKLGRADLTVVCYQRAMELHPRVATNARPELKDLLDANPGLHTLPPERIVPELAEAGLPAGDTGALCARTRDALVATTDANLFNLARALCATLLEFERDDALVDVRQSLVMP